MNSLLSMPFAILLLLLGTWQLGMAQPQFELKALSTSQGLSHQSIWSIAQDRDGYMWFGTLNGLSRYDGYGFTNFRPNPRQPLTTLRHSIIRGILDDSKGRIWVVTNGGGLNQIDKLTGRVTHYSINPTSTTQWNVLFGITEDTNGNIWVNGMEGLACLDPKKKTFTLYLTPRTNIWRVVSGKNGTLWIIEGGVLKLFDLPHQKITVYKTPSVVSEIATDAEGTLWAFTVGDGLYRTVNVQRSTRLKRFIPRNTIGKRVYFNGLTISEKGKVWLWTELGIHSIDPTTTENFTISTSSLFSGPIGESRSYGGIFVDRDENVWLATSLGVLNLRFSKKPFHVGKIEQGTQTTRTSANIITSLLLDHSGTLWLSNTSSYLTGIFDSKFYSKKPGSQKLSRVIDRSTRPFFSIAEGKRGSVWFGSYDTLYVKEKDSERIEVIPIGNVGIIRSLQEDSEGRLWLGYGGRRGQFGGGIASFDPVTKQFKFYRYGPENSNGFRDGTVFQLLVSREGKVWVAFSGGGVASFDPKTEQIKVYEVSSTARFGHLNDKDCRSLYEDKAGIIWIGTNQGGLHRLDPTNGAITFYSTADGLPSNHISSIIGDDKGNLWLGTYQGLSRFNPNTGTFRNYDTNDGLPDNEFTLGAVQKKDGRLWYGTMNGYVHFDPDSIKDNPIPPPVYLSVLKINGKERALPEDALELFHSENFLSLDFVALNYNSPGKNQYAYMLEGVDKDWVQSGNRRYVSYSDLEPGKYVFRVKASNNDGVWNEKGPALPITIHPPWWHSDWAYAIYGLLLLVVVGIFDRYRRRRILEKERERTRDRELAQAKEIEQAYFQLRATQSQLIQKEKLASLGELTAGIAHEIQNPLNFVNNYSEVNVELIEELQEEVERNNKEEIKAILADLSDNERKIHHHGRRADAIVRGMLEHARATPGEKVPTDLNALADEYLRLAYHGLRAKDSDFKCELITDFDPNLGKVAVAPSELGRVLLNLFNNAFYAVRQRQLVAVDQAYTPTVWVSTTKLPLLEGEGRGEVKRQEVTIKVRDNGTGMPEEIKAKIFQPFFTTKPTGEGTGLGLSLSYDIVTKGHGGVLRVDSCVGEGTEFVVELPTN